MPRYSAYRRTWSARAGPVLALYFITETALHVLWILAVLGDMPRFEASPNNEQLMLIAQWIGEILMHAAFLISHYRSVSGDNSEKSVLVRIVDLLWHLYKASHIAYTMQKCPLTRNRYVGTHLLLHLAMAIYGIYANLRLKRLDAAMLHNAANAIASCCWLHSDSTRPPTYSSDSLLLGDDDDDNDGTRKRQPHRRRPPPLSKRSSSPVRGVRSTPNIGRVSAQKPATNSFVPPLVHQSSSPRRSARIGRKGGAKSPGKRQAPPGRRFGSPSSSRSNSSLPVVKRQQPQKSPGSRRRAPYRPIGASPSRSRQRGRPLSVNPRSRRSRKAVPRTALMGIPVTTSGAPESYVALSNGRDEPMVAIVRSTSISEIEAEPLTRRRRRTAY